jgi:hypothetical protein
VPYEFYRCLGITIDIVFECSKSASLDMALEKYQRVYRPTAAVVYLF